MVAAVVTLEEETESNLLAKLFAGLGALGGAMQNYQAVALFLIELAKGFGAVASGLKISLKVFALATGGLCSGLVNYWMNLELLEDFIKRMKSDEEYLHIRLKLNFWESVQYFGGIFVFITTGILFGLMAFAFAMTGPLGLLAIAAGVLVSGIMIVQEVETWLQSYENNDEKKKLPLTPSQKRGKWTGHLIAVGNVIALSLLFTLGLAQALILFNVAAIPAIIIGASIAFSFGAFTEFYFYNHYLADFCQKHSEKFETMNALPNAKLGYLCVTTNAFVNAALAYSGIQMLATLLIASSIIVPPVGLVIAAAALCAVFAGAASFILGVDFWIRANTKAEPKENVSQENMPVRTQSEDSPLTQFSLFKPVRTTHENEGECTQTATNDTEYERSKSFG